MKKFISNVVSGVILSSVFAFGGETTITDKNLVDSNSVEENGKYKTYYCYKTLGNIVKGEYSQDLGSQDDYQGFRNYESWHNNNKFELSNLKQLELFDEFKVAKEAGQKLDKKNQEIKKMISDRDSKIKDIAIKMGCVTKDKVKDDNDGYSATFPNSLKEVYEAMLKELDNVK